MVGMARNKQKFWYALYLRSEDIKDQNGNITGRKPVYSRAFEANGNVSRQSGAAALTQFGLVKQNVRSISPMPLDCPIDEYSLLWIDTDPDCDSDGFPQVANDYVVQEVQESLNAKRYVLQSVEASGVKHA